MDISKLSDKELNNLEQTLKSQLDEIERYKLRKDIERLEKSNEKINKRMRGKA